MLALSRWKVFAGVLSLLLAANAAAVDLTPGSDVIIDGTVVSVVSHDAFWFEGNGVRALVYHHVLLPGEVYDGQRLLVHGRVSDDWMRLTETEINARRIDRPEDLAATP